MSPAQKEARLEAVIGRYRRVLVAFSGGVDSAYLAFIAHRVLGDAAVMVTALSPSVSAMQENLARDFARRYGLNHRVIESAELEDPNYAANPSNRCYFCKSELFTRLDQLREEWGMEVVFDGSNADDLGDHRPGRAAAAENAVVSPLVEAGMTKQDIRERSRAWDLPTADLPAMPCLASRLPYGVAVTRDKLRQVEQAEDFLRRLGFREFRVRHHESLARLEISPAEMPRLLDLHLLDHINRELRRLGYTYVTLDLQGFRSGSLNEQLLHLSH
jgi:uncharacterized protein